MAIRRKGLQAALTLTALVVERTMQRTMTVFLYYYRCCCQGYYDIRIICCRLGDWGPYLHVIVVISIHGLLFIKVAVAAAPRPPPPVGAI